MNLYGNVLFDDFGEKVNDVDFELVEKILKRPIVKPRYRVSVLNPDESIDYIIPENDIPQDGISYTEEYLNGQRKNVTLKLINDHGKYTPSINGIWLTTKFRLDVGIEIKNKIIWFPKGVYIMGDVSLTHYDSDRTITIQLKDKYAIFEGKTGTLEDAYEVALGSTIEDAMKGIMNFSLGNGYILDYKPIILDPSFVGFKTQTTIRADEGENLGKIIEALATLMSAEYYYNNVGNLCFYPINETVDDSTKPIIWNFSNINRELHNLELNYLNENIVNVIKVVGDNIDNIIYSAVVSNDNPMSPICVQRVGRRIAPKYSESNIWSDDLAYDLARYYLRKASFVSVDFSCNVSFNPILSVNNICEIENKALNYHREKLLITSISFGSGDGQMSLKLCNTKDLPVI